MEVNVDACLLTLWQQKENKPIYNPVVQQRHQPTSLNASIKWNYLFLPHLV